MNDILSLTLKSTPVLSNLTSVAEFGTHMLLEPVLQKREEINQRLQRMEEQEKEAFQLLCCGITLCQFSR